MADFILTLLKSLFTTSDCIILVVFISNLCVFIAVQKYTSTLKSQLNSSERLANPKKEHIDPNKPISQTDEDEIIHCQEKMNFWYVLFSNITSIFPLLGMLGTVKSLIGIAGGSETTDMDLFFQALTSTAWGIIFAIICKVSDALVSAKIAANNKDVDVLLERNNAKKQKELEYSYED